MDKKIFNTYKDQQKPLAIKFHIEEIDAGTIKPTNATSFGMGFDAGINFIFNLMMAMEFENEKTKLRQSS